MDGHAEAEGETRPVIISPITVEYSGDRTGAGLESGHSHGYFLEGAERMRKERKYRVLARGSLLGPKVLAVLSITWVPDTDRTSDQDEKILNWAVYLGAVLTADYEQEWKQVAQHGDKQSVEIGVAVFGEMAKYFAKYRK